MLLCCDNTFTHHVISIGYIHTCLVQEFTVVVVSGQLTKHLRYPTANLSETTTMLCVKGCGLVGETQSSIRAHGSVFVSGIVRQFLSVSPPPLAMSVTPDPLADTEAAVDNVR